MSELQESAPQLKSISLENELESLETIKHVVKRAYFCLLYWVIASKFVLLWELSICYVQLQILSRSVGSMYIQIIPLPPQMFQIK